jgi:hemerythrin
MRQKIQKVIITNGVYIVDIPDVDLQILCAAPADVVKHLTQKGYIVSAEKKGVSYETGPNAILLSDISVQNTSFSNLGEFPVLQMLYRQGMIIPNHPNNTGNKPLLIGSQKQIKSQLNYIHRGNYGLISKEEIMATGISEEEAKEMMRMKLKFAFGKIQDPSNLLNSIVVDGRDNEVEIKDGVKISRTQTNKFTISYQDESVSVDLNLPSDKHYVAPYNLGYYDIKREYFAVIHSGQGDGWDIHRPSMGSVIMYHGEIYLVDAGPNIMNVLQSLGIGSNEIKGLFHTHAHDDHFAGITTLIQTGHKIKYFATPLVRASVTKKISALLDVEEDEFEKYFEICDLEFDNWTDIDGLEVMPIFSPHPIETNIFIFRTIWEDGYKTYAHFADITSFSVLGSMITDDPNEPGITEEFFEKVKDNYLQEVMLKKIDVGGGMIHGDAKDFVWDKTDKMILAHTSSRDLTQTQKSIGSGAPFGGVDVLIPDNQDLLRRSMHNYLTAHFPSITSNQIRILLNCQIKTFNPESILLREYQSVDKVYLVLTGIVEMIEYGAGTNSTLISSGAFIGELNTLLDIHLNKTYRAVSYVKALEIPSELFTVFIKYNNLEELIGKRVIKFEILNDFPLFSDLLSFAVLNDIAHSLETKEYNEGDDILCSCDDSCLFLLASGEVEKYVDEDHIFKVKERGFFGEEQLITNKPTTYKYTAKSNAVVHIIPNETIKNIPSIYWQLFESYKKAMRSL